HHRQGHGGPGRHAHDGHEGDAGDEQTYQGDDHGQPGEDDRAARGRQGFSDGLVDVVAAGELVAVAGEDEQRVVDADRQAQHRAERSGDRRDLEPGRQCHHGEHRDRDADDGGDDRDHGRDEGAEDDGEDQQGRDHPQHLTGVEGDLRVLQHLTAEVRFQLGAVGGLDDLEDLVDGGGGELPDLTVHLELGDHGGAVVAAGSGGEDVEGGGCGLHAFDVLDLVHDVVDGSPVLLDLGTVIGDEDHLPGGPAHLGEPGGEIVDAALGLGAGDLELGGEGAAQGDAERTDRDQQHGPERYDLPPGRGHGTSEAVQG